jgi:transposase
MTWARPFDGDIGRRLLRARADGLAAACPACGAVSRRVHSRYERRLSDTPVAGQQTMIELQVRRFFCGNDACGRKTFAEQVPGLTVRYGRTSADVAEARRGRSRWRWAAARGRGWRPGWARSAG